MRRLDHFRTNIAYLPELQGHLDDLLRTRERLAATIDGVDDRARADATLTVAIPAVSQTA